MSSGTIYQDGVSEAEDIPAGPAKISFYSEKWGANTVIAIEESVNSEFVPLLNDTKPITIAGANNAALYNVHSGDVLRFVTSGFDGSEPIQWKITYN